MAKNGRSHIANVLKAHEADLVADWIKELKSAGSAKDTRISRRATFLLKRKSLSAFCKRRRNPAGHSTPTLPIGERHVSSSPSCRVREWSKVFLLIRPLLSSFPSRSHCSRRLRAELSGDANALADETWAATELLDQLGMQTMKSFQATREALINRQQEEMLELSTPVVKLWDGILRCR